jgi:hypothetical protein
MEEGLPSREELGTIANSWGSAGPFLPLRKGLREVLDLEPRLLGSMGGPTFKVRSNPHDLSLSGQRKSGSPGGFLEAVGGLLSRASSSERRREG